MTAEQLVEALRADLVGKENLLQRMIFLVPPEASFKYELFQLRDKAVDLYKNYDNAVEQNKKKTKTKE